MALRDTAALRLDALRRAQDQDADARQSGPFHRESDSALANILSEVHDKDRPAVSVPPVTPKAPTPSVDIVKKYKQPGLDTVPHSTALSDTERKELFEEIDMERPAGRKPKPNFQKD